MNALKKGQRRKVLAYDKKKNDIFFLVLYSKKNVDKNVPNNKKLIIANFLVNLVRKKIS